MRDMNSPAVTGNEAAAKESAEEILSIPGDTPSPDGNSNLNDKPRVRFPWLPFLLCLVLLAATLWLSAYLYL